MPSFLRAFFDTRLLNPHGICLLWRPELLWTHVASDVLIGLAYFSIPLALGAFLYHRRDVRFGWAIWMFVAFIMLCGVTHFMSIWTLWRPDYGVEALVKAATAAASLTTALALWPLLPRVIAIPSTEQLQASVRERDEALTRLEAAMRTMVAMEEHQAEQARLMSALQRKEEDLRDSEQRLLLALEAGQMGSWEWDISTGKSVWSEGHFEILGYDPHELEASFEAWADRVHPDDRAWVNAQVDRADQGKEELHPRYRVVQPASENVVLASRTTGGRGCVRCSRS